MTERNRRMMWIGTVLAALLVGGGSALADEPARAATAPTSRPAAGADPAGWPQWRGPSRDGVAQNSLKLLDSWPEKGPKLLWESAPIPSYSNQGGGVGSPVVADGKVFLFNDEPKKNGPKMLTTKQLQDWGWDENITAELATKLDKQWSDTGVGGDKPEAPADAFLATLEQDTVKKIGRDKLKTHLREGWTTHISWQTLLKLATRRDKEAEFTEEETTYKSVAGNMVYKALLKNMHSYVGQVICLDAATGKELWRKEFPGIEPRAGWRDMTASGTPALAGGKCFVASGTGVLCLAAKDGAVLWQTPLKMDGNGSSPLVAGNALYLNTTEGMIALSVENGKLLWTQSAVRNVGASVTLWRHEGKDYLLTLDARSLACVEPDDGKVLWKVGNLAEQFSTPVVVGDTAIVHTTYGLGSFALSPKQATPGWWIKLFGDSSCPVIYQDHVYITGGGEMGSGVACVSIATGEAKWKQRVKYSIITSPVFVDGKLISFFERFDKDARIAMFRASPEKFEELGYIARPGDKPWYCGFSSPAIANGRLYVRLANGIACYDLRAGEN